MTIEEGLELIDKKGGGLVEGDSWVAVGTQDHREWLQIGINGPH